MEKIEGHFDVRYSIDWENNNSIAQIRADLDELEKLGATHITFDTYISYESANLEIKAYSVRLETDEEYKERIEAQNKKLEEIKQKELQQLQKLKEKYGL